MDLDLGDLGPADPALVVLDARVLLAVVLQHLGEGVELHCAVGALEVLGEHVGVAGQVALHPLLLVRPEGAADHLKEAISAEFDF